MTRDEHVTSTAARPHIDRIGILLLLVGLAVHWLVLFSLPTGKLNPLFHDAARSPGHGLDFYSIYQSGHNVLNKMSAYYGVREHRYGSQHQVVPYFSGFRYLPVYAYTYGVFLNVLPPQQSYWMWIVMVEGLLIACIVLTFRLTRHSGKPYRYIAIWLLYSPYYIELYIGQQSFVTALLIFIMGWAVI
ncbi:MAG TPA: hypothetical protein PKJ15_07990, partial [Methanomassiliicoccales archaeon]|nr:hypothetical protein [Methanomassiliicoccales archaeon]